MLEATGGLLSLLALSWLQKRKVEGRAAKLVKMAHSTARAARQDTDGTVRKVKFRLPTAAGMEKVILLTVSETQGSTLHSVCFLRLSSCLETFFHPFFLFISVF